MKAFYFAITNHSKYIIMHKFIVFFALLLGFFEGISHGADNSTFVLKEQDNGTWTLQVRSSLDAFRKEVKTYFYDCPYKTPEEFSAQVLEHFDNSLKLTVNNNVHVPLLNGKVKLGHETVVFYQNIKLPKDFDTLFIEGAMFREIFRSKVKVLILKKEFEKNAFFLSKKNAFTLNLVAKEHKFTLWSEEEEL